MEDLSTLQKKYQSAYSHIRLPLNSGMLSVKMKILGSQNTKLHVTIGEYLSQLENYSFKNQSTSLICYLVRLHLAGIHENCAQCIRAHKESCDICAQSGRLPPFQEPHDNKEL